MSMNMTSAMKEGYFLSFPPLTSLIIAASIATLMITVWAVRQAIESFFLPKLRVSGLVLACGYLSGRDASLRGPGKKQHRPSPGESWLFQTSSAERWYAYVQTDSESLMIEISASLSQRLKPGDRVMIETSYGRITNTRHGIKILDSKIAHNIQSLPTRQERNHEHSVHL